MVRGSFRSLSRSSVLPSLSAFRSFGFVGRRFVWGGDGSLPLLAARVASLVASLSPAFLAVGCASGVDAAVRAAVPSALVFSAARFRFRSCSRRSVALVLRLARRPSPCLVAFPGAPCPVGLFPSVVWRRCLCFGSGSWLALSVAVARGVPCFVFLGSLPAPSGRGWGFVPVPRSPGWWLALGFRG